MKRIKTNRAETKIVLIILVISIVSGNNNVELGCPCVSIDICPRVLGMYKSDQILLESISACMNPGFVRCCGVSSSVEINSSPYTVNYDVTLKTTEFDVPSTTITPEEITVVTVLPELSINEMKHRQRQVKMDKNISIIYPSEMSGIPKTTPSNMPEDQMMKMTDDYSGDEMFIIFPNAEEDIETTTTIVFTTKPPEIITTTHTEAPINKNEAPSSKPKIKKRRKYHPQRIKSKETTVKVAEKNKIDSDVEITTKTADDSLDEISKIYNNRRVSLRKYLTSLTSDFPLSQPETKTEKPFIDISEDEYSHNRIGRKHIPRKIYDTSSRMNFLRRTSPDTSTVATLPPDPSALYPVFRPALNRELQSKIDTDHKIMIEHVHLTLASHPTNSDETARAVMDENVNGRVINIENNVVDKMTEMVNKMIGFKTNLLNDDGYNTVTTARPFRGNKKYMLPVWTNFEAWDDYITPKPIKRPAIQWLRTRGTTTTTAQPEITTSKSYSRRKLTRRTSYSTIRTLPTTTPTTTTTTTITEKFVPTTEEPEHATVSKLSVSNSSKIQEQPTENSLPYNEFKISQNPLLSDFKPSPLWTLHMEDNIQYQQPIPNVVVPSHRTSRNAFKVPTTYNGFVPVVHTGKPLSIVGPIPNGFKVIKDEVPYIGLELPAS